MDANVVDAWIEFWKSVFGTSIDDYSRILRRFLQTFVVFWMDAVFFKHPFGFNTIGTGRTSRPAVMPTHTISTLRDEPTLKHTVKE